MARALFAAGFRAGDLVHNSFSYHLTPAGSMMESGAHAIGCTVFPGGTGQTELQLQAMAALAPTAYVGTPSFLRLLLEKADETGIALPSLRKALAQRRGVAGRALRDWLGARGIAAYQSYGTADLGLVAYETAAREGLVVDEGVDRRDRAPRHRRPGRRRRGRRGRRDDAEPRLPADPLRAPATCRRCSPGTCPTGRTNPRIRGWLGRADQSTKVRGMFVHPSQVAEIVRRHPGDRAARGWSSRARWRTTA